MDKKLYKLYPSTRSEKKFDIYVLTKTGRVKKVSFGAKGYEDYTIHKDKERRSRYRIRHKKDKIRDPTTPGFWSWWVLWGESSNLQKALADTKRKFKLTGKKPTTTPKTKSRKVRSGSRKVKKTIRKTKRSRSRR